MKNKSINNSQDEPISEIKAFFTSASLKNSFITGLVLLLPVALTIAIVIFIFNLLTEPFAGIVSSVFNYYGVLSQGFAFWSAVQIQQFVSKVLVFITLIAFTILLGYVTRWFFIHYLLRFGDYLFTRIPFIRTVYKACQDIIKTLFASKANSFKQVVLVPFPSQESNGIGFLTREGMPHPENPEKQEMVAVFVPTAPNPTSGFLMMFHQKDIVYLDMKVEDAFKYIISCGVLSTPVNIVTREAFQAPVVESEPPTPHRNHLKDNDR